MTWPNIFIGTFVEAVGIGLLAWAMHTEKSPTVFGMMALVGVGTGLRFMAAPLHGVGRFRNHRAAVIGLMAVAIPLGGTIGLTVMSTVFNNASGHDVDTDFSHIRQETPDMQAEPKEKAKVSSYVVEARPLHPRKKSLPLTMECYRWVLSGLLSPSHHSSLL